MKKIHMLSDEGSKACLMLLGVNACRREGGAKRKGRKKKGKCEEETLVEICPILHRQVFWSKSSVTLSWTKATRLICSQICKQAVITFSFKHRRDETFSQHQAVGRRSVWTTEHTQHATLETVGSCPISHQQLTSISFNRGGDAFQTLDNTSF